MSRIARLPFALAALLSLAPLGSPLARAVDHWPTWRGPQQNGVAPGKGYPTTWSKTENVVWKTALPGKGSSTPVIWGDRIFLTCGVGGDNVALALDRSGKKLWQTAVGKERPGKHKKATGSNPSAVTDGKHLFVYFKSGDLACLDFDGKLVWQQNLQTAYGEDTLWWDLGTSPVLTENAVVVAVMQTGPSFLVAYDKETGKPVWKQDRNLNAPSEAAQSYSTPVVLRDADRELLVVLGADHVTGHDAKTGGELWRVGGLNPTGHQYFRSIASAVVENGVVIAPYARGATLTGVKLGGQGDVTKSHVAWTIDGLGADVPTPAAHGGRVFVCTDKGDLAVLDAATGKKLATGQLERNRNAYSASPIVADDRLYLVREDGKTFVVSTDGQFKVLAANELDGEFMVATPVFADGRIYLRTLENLYCVGK